MNFSYYYRNHYIHLPPPLAESEMSIEIHYLLEAFQMGMSDKEKNKIILKYDQLDLFNQALSELYIEELIEFKNDNTILITNKGEEMFIIPNRWYKKID